MQHTATASSENIPGSKAAFCASIFVTRIDCNIDGLLMSMDPIILMTGVGGILKDGFELGGRRFEFLAYSTSALREHAVWFITPLKRDGVWVDSEFI